MSVRVRCRESVDYEWEEVTHLIDFSRLGAQFATGRRVEPGQLLHLSFAMPNHLRAFDYAAAQYQVWAVVRRVKEVSAGGPDDTGFEVGVAFVGRSAPASFMIDPTKRYDLKPVPRRDGLWQARERPRNEDY
jgi:hypothetical protein